MEYEVPNQLISGAAAGQWDTKHDEMPRLCSFLKAPFIHHMQLRLQHVRSESVEVLTRKRESQSVSASGEQVVAKQGIDTINDPYER